MNLRAGSLLHRHLKGSKLAGRKVMKDIVKIVRVTTVAKQTKIVKCYCGKLAVVWCKVL